MALPEKELTPVIYNSAAIKLLHFVLPCVGKSCFSMHWHERMELLRITRGKMLVDFGTVQREAGPDTLVIIHPRQPHKAVCTEAPLEYDTIMFDVRSFYNETESCLQYLTDLQEGEIHFVSCTRCPEVLNCVDQIVASRTEGFRALAVTAKIYQLIYELFNHCLQENSPVSSFDRATKEIVRYIETHYAEPMTVEELAARFGYTKPYFCRKFRESTGLPPMKYLNIFRIETAYHMIRYTSEEIGRIGASCGFQDPNYFARCFKNHFGHTPSYYRRKT